MSDFTKIKAWQRADDLVAEVYDLTQGISDDKDNGLKTEMRQAAISVPVSIVQGSAKNSRPDFLNFLSDAMSSLKELEYYGHLSKRLGYFNEGKYQKLKLQIDETAKILFGLIRYIENQLSPEG